MKKISLLLIFIFCLFITACDSKEELEVKTLNDFQIACNNNGFSVDNNKKNYVNVSYITDAMVANLNDIEIEMVIYDTKENADKAHDNQVNVFKTMKGSGAVIEKDKGKNYYKYDMISNGYYMVSTQVDNTLVFCKTPVANKDKVTKVLSDMGY